MNRTGSLIIDGYYGYGSIGDECIFMGIMNNVDHVFVKKNVVLISKDPQKTFIAPSEHVTFVGRTAIDWLVKIPSHVLRSEYYVFGGGNLLNDRSFYTLPFFLIKVLFVRLLRKKFLIYGQSIGPFRTSFGQILLKIGCILTNKITVRDAESLIFLNKIGIQSILAPDLAFSAKLVSLQNSGLLLSEKKLNPVIGVIIRSSWDFVAYLKNFEDAIVEMANHFIKKYDAKIIFIPFLNNAKTLSSSSDIIAINAMIKNIKSPRNCSIKQVSTASDVVETFLSLDLVIGVPLHSIILSAITGRPFISITYHPKVTNFLDSVAYPVEYTFNPSKITGSKLICALEDLWFDRSNINRQLLSCTKTFFASVTNINALRSE